MKKRLGIIYGGESPEHEISIRSAKGVMEVVDPGSYEIIPIYIDREGCWHQTEKGEAIDRFTAISTFLKELDVVFPLVHGKGGEDGALQGMLEMLQVPYVGARVLGSAIGMDKDVTKRLCRDAGIDVPSFVVVHKDYWEWEIREHDIKYPCVVKPANMGSSIGLQKVMDESHLSNALDQAFCLHPKCIIEEFCHMREFECSVLEGETLFVSTLGEILPKDTMYTYNNKYIDRDGAKFVVPAELDEEMIRNAKQLALKAFRTLCCEGMARVDLFLTDDGRWLLNEINTIPGFTSISLYPKLWEVSELSFEELVDALLEFALQRTGETQVPALMS